MKYMKNGLYVSENDTEYEIYENQIMVEHENGYYGCLYGKSSMSIFKDNKEVLHTGFRNINTPDELYGQHIGMCKPNVIEPLDIVCCKHNNESDE